ncbi:hypothetical protein M9H77_26342 [Catharanthus roseus]|uniref:Uncharacterized protein n=1 Tax=Catharanthus roseus TaxID=4058 RepID=A0ACC0A9Q9_CATRO|nr:hypothetical protein M9H77_26342 [Catharanthus roseus]
MDFEMRDLASLLDQISVGPISKAREMRRIAKGVLSPRRSKTNSTKRNKLYWEHVSIAHRKIQKSSKSGLGSGSSSGSGSHGKGRLPWAPSGRGKDRGCSSERSSLSSVIDPSTPSIFSFIDAFPSFGNCGCRVVADFVFGDENQWPKYWLDTPDSLYVIANAFNLCVVLIARLGSTTFFPLYSYSDCTARTLFIGHLYEKQHFITLQMRDECLLPLLHVQSQYYRSDRVSGWAEPYSDRIADWKTRYRREYLQEDPIHVNLWFFS